MSKRRIKQVPRYFGLRIYALSTILFFMLVFPVAIILVIKNIPDYIEASGIQLHNDSITSRVDSALIRLDTVNARNPASEFRRGFEAGARVAQNTKDTTLVNPATTEEEQELTVEDARMQRTFILLVRLLIISFLLGFIFNLPFKIYFRKKRKRKKMPDKLFRYCKRLLLKTPLINSSILALPFVVTMGVLGYKLIFYKELGEMSREFYTQFFLISAVSAILTILFVYFWQKHRVHIKYLEHLYSEEELRKRIFNIKVGKIKNRLWTSSAMTTLLPLVVVMFYLLLSFTTVRELGIDNLGEEHLKILLGKYSTMSSNIGLGSFNKMFYVNAINSVLMLTGISMGILIAFLYLLFFVKWTTEDIVYPVRELLANIDRTGRGELDSYAIVRTNDEIGVLTEGFNDMSAKLKGYIDSIYQINEANSRFVPRQFLEFLGKESIVDIKLGDQVQKEMTVLFSDIRDFTTISESMTPKENFDYLNNYLGYMEPVIRNNNGFIDKYIGDSIMALFPNKSEDALNAAIEMRIKLTEFNNIVRQFGHPSINSGIGVHAGSLMLGVVGGEGRMDGTVISDAVNLTSRVEGLSKVYKSSVIITEDTLIRLKDPGSYNYRFLDIVKVKGKKEAVYIFELIDGETDEQRALKLETKETFGEAVQHYKKHNFEDALQEFKRVLKKNPDDGAAGVYIQRCQRFIKEGVPKDWDGATALDYKF